MTKTATIKIKELTQWDDKISNISEDINYLVFDSKKIIQEIHNIVHQERSLPIQEITYECFDAIADKILDLGDAGDTNDAIFTEDLLLVLDELLSILKESPTLNTAPQGYLSENDITYINHLLNNRIVLSAPTSGPGM